MAFKNFETDRLFLQPTSAEDAGFILQLLNTPKWIKYIGDRKVKTLGDAEHYISKRITLQFERLGYGNYTLVRKMDSVKIGSCGLYDRKGLEGIDIGFALLPEYEGQGYAFEAADKLKRIATAEFGITVIRAITTKDNFSSQKLLEKLGLSQTGTTQLPDDEEELLVYEIVDFD